MLKRKLRIALNYYAAALFTVLGMSCAPKDNEVTPDVHIIPEPLELKVTEGNFNFNEQTVVIVNSNNKEVKQVANYFVEQFNIASGSSLKISVSSENSSASNSIIFTDKNVDETLGNEGYSLQSNAQNYYKRNSKWPFLWSANAVSTIAR